jgi:CDP-6-deoxy-D-xylo-4-hexulose-3-dehydrase
MSGADRIMNESIFVGVYPGLTRAMLDYMVETIGAFCKKT